MSRRSGPNGRTTSATAASPAKPPATTCHHGLSVRRAHEAAADAMPAAEPTTRIRPAPVYRDLTSSFVDRFSHQSDRGQARAGARAYPAATPTTPQVLPPITQTTRIAAD